MYEIRNRHAGTGNQEAKVMEIDINAMIWIVAECPYCEFENRTVIILRQIGLAFVRCGSCRSFFDVINPFYTLLAASQDKRRSQGDA